MRKKKLIDYLLDLCAVVFGVFLGMLASDWNANQNLNKNRDAFLE